MQLMHCTVSWMSWRGLIDFGVSDDQAQRLLTDGGIKIGLAGYVEKAAQMLRRSMRTVYRSTRHYFCSAAEDSFRNSEFHLETGAIDIRDKEFKRTKWESFQRGF